MKFADLLSREPPKPWTDGAKLPWSDAAFSTRMLHEHLSQDHDRASRRLEVIDRHVDWLHTTVLRSQPRRVLDLGCGPGLYAARLAARGHSCVGIDFSPASIAYARAEARRRGLSCEYRLQDLRAGDFGRDFQAILLISGEFNTFAPPEARALLANAHRALAPSGAVVLEVHTDGFVRQLGGQSPTWFTAQKGLFSGKPYLGLRECTWHLEARVAIERYFIIEHTTSEVRTYLSTTQAYTSSEYASLLRESGFGRFETHPSLEGATTPTEEGLYVLVGWRDAP